MGTHSHSDLNTQKKTINYNNRTLIQTKRQSTTMPTITTAISNFMWRRNAERVETEEPEHDLDEEEGTFVGGVSSGPTTETITSNDRPLSPILEAISDDEDEESLQETASPSSTTAAATEEEQTQQESTTNGNDNGNDERFRNFTLADLEQERDNVLRRNGCIGFSSYVLILMWLQSFGSGDLGLLALSLVLSCCLIQYVEASRDRVETLNVMIREWNDGDRNGGHTNTIDERRLRRMSMRSQLALAIMQSHLHMIENGGYGHPDGHASKGNGVSEAAKRNWNRFEFNSRASLAKRENFGHSSSVFTIDDDDDDDVLKKSGQEEEEEPLCSICLCEYEKGDRLVSLPCKHVFHEECITSWTDHNTRCPLCNADLEEQSATIIAGDEAV